MSPDGENRNRVTDGITNDGCGDIAPNGQDILFLSDRREYKGIYSINIFTKKVSNIVSEYIVAPCPRWSPDGQRIVFSSQGVIFIVNRDGSEITPLPTQGYASTPHWSPNGTMIAFSCNKGSDNDIFIMKIDGSDIVQITNNLVNDENPVWQP